MYSGTTGTMSNLKDRIYLPPRESVDVQVRVYITLDLRSEGSVPTITAQNQKEFLHT